MSVKLRILIQIIMEPHQKISLTQMAQSIQTLIMIILFRKKLHRKILNKQKKLRVSKQKNQNLQKKKNQSLKMTKMAKIKN
jgi:hypothetical protein